MNDVFLSLTVFLCTMYKNLKIKLFFCLYNKMFNEHLTLYVINDITKLKNYCNNIYIFLFIVIKYIFKVSLYFKKHVLYCKNKQNRNL